MSITRRRETTKEELVKIITLWPKCESIKEIADKIGRDSFYVRKYSKMFREEGINLPKKIGVGRTQELITEIANEIANKK